MIEHAPYVLDWDSLPPEERWTAQNIASRMAYGFSREVLGAFFGQSPNWVSTRMSKLRRAIEQQLGEEP